MGQVAVIIPAMRAHRLPAVVDTIIESTSDYHIVVLGTGDCAEVARSLPVTLIDDGGGTWPERINRGYKATTEPYIMTGADDLCFHAGWLESALRTMDTLPEGSGVVAVNDGYNANGVHFVIAKSYIDGLGGVLDKPPGVIACEAYPHSHVDDEIRATAKYRGRWAIAKDAYVEHLHWGAGKAPHDAIYAVGNASMSQGHSVFMSRKHLWNG